MWAPENVSAGDCRVEGRAGKTVDEAVESLQHVHNFRFASEVIIFFP